MREKGKLSYTEAEKEALLQMRSQAIVAARMRERAQEQTNGLRSLRLDGMPKGPAQTGGLDARMIRREEAERMLRREEARLRRMEKKARESMAKMRPELYAFCAMYYVGGLSLTETAEAIDRSVRQCMRYRREIEAGEEDDA
ncbi:MAG: hypothetical protein IKV90_05430 [Clostridia bacterium]|nr:hypothetical protein [Clostridia bacterium]